MAKQLLRSGTSVGANLEEARTGQSKADFIAKLSISRKEAAESLYWLRLMAETSDKEFSAIPALLQEADEIVAILTAITRTAKERR